LNRSESYQVPDEKWAFLNPTELLDFALKRTAAELPEQHGVTSAFGTKRTSKRRPAMSAFGGKTDINERQSHVRFCPKADILVALGNVCF